MIIVSARSPENLSLTHLKYSFQWGIVHPAWLRMRACSQVNPLTPKGDNITPESHMKVTRIDETITN